MPRRPPSPSSRGRQNREAKKVSPRHGASRRIRRTSPGVDPNAPLIRKRGKEQENSPTERGSIMIGAAQEIPRDPGPRNHERLQQSRFYRPNREGNSGTFDRSVFSLLTFSLLQGNRSVPIKGRQRPKNLQFHQLTPSNPPLRSSLRARIRPICPGSVWLSDCP